MNAIIGMSAVAFNYLDDKKRTADCLSKITFSSKHLLMLLNDVLDMSKIENGKLNIRQELFDLKNLVTSLADINYGLATAKGLAFEIVISGFKDELLLGDSSTKSCSIYCPMQLNLRLKAAVSGWKSECCVQQVTRYG